MDSSLFPPLNAKGGKRSRNKTNAAGGEKREPKVEKPRAEPQPAAPQEVPGAPQIPENAMQFIQDLADIEKRGAALDGLCKLTENYPDIAIPLWYSYGTVVILLEEIVNVYPYLSEKNKDIQGVPLYTILQRVCKALTLVQSIASHPKTQHFLIKIDIISFLTPIFALMYYEREIEFLRLTSLGIIGAMSKTRDPEIQYLIEKEALTVCIVSIRHATEISRVVATFILSKLLSDDYALEYVCETDQRITSVASLLFKVLNNALNIKKDVKPRLIRYSIDCLYRLSTNVKAIPSLKALVASSQGVCQERALAEFLTQDPNLKQKFETFCLNVGVIGPNVKVGMQL